MQATQSKTPAGSIDRVWKGTDIPVITATPLYTDACGSLQLAQLTSQLGAQVQLSIVSFEAGNNGNLVWCHACFLARTCLQDLNAAVVYSAAYNHELAAATS